MVSCGGDKSQQTQQINPPAAPLVMVDADIMQLIFSWGEVADATHYRLLENPDGHSGFTQAAEDIPAGTLTVTKQIAVHLHDWVNALYVVQACNIVGCSSSSQISATDVMLNAIGYFKASNTGSGDRFGSRVAISADGKTLLVGADGEDSKATGINGDQADNATSLAGAVYVFRHDGAEWFQEAYIKASNAGSNDFFGLGLALSSDGNTLAVGAYWEQSSATGIDGDQDDNSADKSGAVYVFRFGGSDWYQQAYIKASNSDEGDQFGLALTLSDDGNTLAVGARSEDGVATGVNGNQNDNSAFGAGAVYLFRFDGADWFQQAYIKASNTGQGDEFGISVALNANGNTLAVGAWFQNDDSGNGAAYVFRFDGTLWYQQAYVKSANIGCCDLFGQSVALAADGNTLAVGAYSEDSESSGINSERNHELEWDEYDSGAAYVFRFDGIDWFEEAYIKASNTDFEVYFGFDVALGAGGNTLAVGAPEEDGGAVGINGNQSDRSGNSGAVYVFRFDGFRWHQHAYVKASNTDSGDGFGRHIALSEDGETLAVGAAGEDSIATGINGDQSDNSESVAGAVYVY